MRARTGVLRFKRGRKCGNRLVVRALQQVALTSLDLEQMPQVARVQEQLLLRLAFLRGAERDPVEAAGEALDDGEQLERAERLPEERVSAGGNGFVRGAAVRTAEDDDRDALRVPRALQMPAKRKAVDAGEVDVEDDRVR